jgi:hypothetical protein
MWTMQCDGLTARCALLALSRRWEIRVIVDGSIMLTEECARPDDAFSLAERWKSRLGEQRWQQIVPHGTGPGTLRRS